MLIPALAAGESSGDGESPVRALALEAAIESTLNHYLGIDLERFSLVQTQTALQSARAAFDARLSASAGLSERQSPRAASELDGASAPLSEEQSVGLGVQRFLGTGGTLGLQSSFTRAETNSTFAALNPNYTTEVSFSLRQPLLRDRGPSVARSRVRNAETDVVRSRLTFQRAILNLVAEVELFYYNLAFAQSRLELRLGAVEIAEVLLRENQQREQIGLATRIDVLQAQSALALRKEELAQSKLDEQNAREQLLRLMGRGDPTLAIRADPLPGEAPLRPSDEYFARVTAYDLDGRIQESVIEQRARSARVARNATLPSLDLILRGGYLGREGSFLDSLDETIARRGYLWNAGLEFSVPWGRRDARARSFLAEADLQREEDRLKLIQQNTVLQARSAFRSVQTALDRIESSQIAVRLNEEVFDRERARYESGLSTFRAVLEAQQELENARFRQLQARFDTLRSRIELSLLDGTLPERLGLDPDFISLLES